MEASTRGPLVAAGDIRWLTVIILVPPRTRDVVPGQRQLPVRPCPLGAVAYLPTAAVVGDCSGILFFAQGPRQRVWLKTEDNAQTSTDRDVDGLESLPEVAFVRTSVTDTAVFCPAVLLLCLAILFLLRFSSDARTPFWHLPSSRRESL